MKTLMHYLCAELAVAFVFIPAALSVAGDGSSATSPIYITSSDYLMDGGTSSAACYYATNAVVAFEGSAYLGVVNANNILAVSNGYGVSGETGYVGLYDTGEGELTLTGSDWNNTGAFVIGAFGGGTVAIQDAASLSAENVAAALYAGSTGGMTVAGDTSTMIASGSLNIGSAGYGSMTVSSGASASVGDGGLYLGNHDTATGVLNITGASSSLTDTSSVYCGLNGVGSITVENGASLTIGGSCFLGIYADSSGTMEATGSGSTVVCASGLHVGSHGVGSLVVDDGALVKATDVSTSGEGTVTLKTGYLAIKGQYSASGILAKMNLRVASGSTTQEATQDNITTTYYTSDNYVAGDDLYDTFHTGKSVDLVGYTVVRAGQSDLSWADVQTDVDNWITSSWYGVFYWYSDCDWAWHLTHGWQYVSAGSGTDIYVWDCGTNSWWFTSQDFYPYVYLFSTPSWYCYAEGSSPNRVFWSYSTNGKVYESSGF